MASNLQLTMIWNPESDSAIVIAEDADFADFRPPLNGRWIKSPAIAPLVPVLIPGRSGPNLSKLIKYRLILAIEVLSPGSMKLHLRQKLDPVLSLALTEAISAAFSMADVSSECYDLLET